MSENPFSEFEDTDRTIIRPAPTGRRVPGAGSPAFEPSRAAPPSGFTAMDLNEFAFISGNPLAAAATPLIQLLGRLKDVTTPPDLVELRGGIVRALSRFDGRTADDAVAPELRRRAHYALCAALDSSLQDVPWGKDWEPLTTEFHPREREGADGFLDLLRTTCGAPRAFMPLIELMYVCLSLASASLSRPQSPGQAGVERLRLQTHALIAAARGMESGSSHSLSPRWQGVSAPYRPRAHLPLWTVASAALAMVALLFAWTSHELNAASDTQYARMLSIPPAGMPRLDRAALARPPPLPPEPLESGAATRLRTALRTDIEEQRVAILASASSTTLRMSARALFGPAGATLTPGGTALLRRIGAALQDASGSIRVIGYTDNQPIRTVQFPSNFHLSAARANAVRGAMLPGIADASRVSAEGRADADPIAANDTADGREQNRRIDLVLQGP